MKVGEDFKAKFCIFCKDILILKILRDDGIYMNCVEELESSVFFDDKTSFLL